MKINLCCHVCKLNLSAKKKKKKKKKKREKSCCAVSSFTILCLYAVGLGIWRISFVVSSYFRKRHLSSHGVSVVAICLYRGLGAAERAKKLAI